MNRDIFEALSASARDVTPVAALMLNVAISLCAVGAIVGFVAGVLWLQWRMW